MLIEIYIFFQVVVISLFLISFWTKQEILWTMTAVFSGIMMATSWTVQKTVYEYNATSMIYEPVSITNSYPYLFGINLLFFSLAVVLGVFDLWDKYGSKFARDNKNAESKEKESFGKERY